MRNLISYLVLLVLSSIPTAFAVWACYLPILVALPAWGLSAIGLSILAGAAWSIHKEGGK